MNIRKPKRPNQKILRIQIDGMPELMQVLNNGFTTLNKKLDLITTSIAENGTPQQRQALADKLDAIIKDVKGTVK